MWRIDGSKLAANDDASANGASVSIWEAEIGRLAIPQIQGHNNGVCSLSWSVTIWDMKLMVQEYRNTEGERVLDLYHI